MAAREGPFSSFLREITCELCMCLLGVLVFVLQTTTKQAVNDCLLRVACEFEWRLTGAVDL